MALLRDQARACLAYTKVAEVKLDLRKDYRIAVQDLGSNLHRMGLATALSLLERRAKVAGSLLLAHVAEANIVGLGVDPKQLPRRAREIDDLVSYMLATRELMRVATWFNRAVQATFTEAEDAQ